MSWLNSAKPRTGIRNEQVFSGRSDMPFALLLLAPSLLCWAVWWRGQWCRISKSVFYVAAQSQHRVNVCWGKQLRAYFSDPGFWHSLWMTVWYTTLVWRAAPCSGWPWRCFSTASSAAQNRAFAGDPLLRNAVYFAVFAWKYMFNNGYGIVNYLGVIFCISMSRHRCGSIIRAVAFAGGAVRHLALLPVCLYLVSAILQTIDKSLYEAAEMDGANPGSGFALSRCPRLCRSWRRCDAAHHLDVLHVRGCLSADDQVDILGVYLYKTAFAFNDLGKRRRSRWCSSSLFSLSFC